MKRTGTNCAEEKDDQHGDGEQGDRHAYLQGDLHAAHVDREKDGIGQQPPDVGRHLRDQIMQVAADAVRDDGGAEDVLDAVRGAANEATQWAESIARE